MTWEILFFLTDSLGCSNPKDLGFEQWNNNEMLLFHYFTATNTSTNTVAICTTLTEKERTEWDRRSEWWGNSVRQSYWCATCNKEISKLLHLQLINFLLASVWKMCTSCVPLNEYCSWTVSHLWIFQCVCCFLFLWWPALYFLCCSVLGHHSWFP